LISALFWTTDFRVMPSPSLTSRWSDETMPRLTLDWRPSGLPIARTMFPTREPEDWASAAGDGFAPLTWTTARSARRQTR
jgi:hypothetical protein